MADNSKNIVVSGFGGQGVLFLGTILCHAAMIENKNTTWIPSYGAEMRGGSANCYVVISDNEIASPIFDSADYGIFLSKQAMKKFENMIIKNGSIFADSSMMVSNKNRDDISYFFKPLNDLIVKNSPEMLLNIVALGYFIKKTGVLKKESVISALKNVSSAKKPEFLELNLKSFEYGYLIE